MLDNGKRVPTDILRLQAQIAVGNALATRVVTFEFTHYLGIDPLYHEYLWLRRYGMGR